MTSHDHDRSSSEKLEHLLPMIYAELRALAQSRLARERRHHTWQPTDLVHEVFLRLQDFRRIDWAGKTHVYAIAAPEMRRLLVNHAKQKGRLKRGGGQSPRTLMTSDAVTSHRPIDVLLLDEVLVELEKRDSRQAKIFEYRAFGGLQNDEIGAILSLAGSTIRDEWAAARAWVMSKISPSEFGS